MAADHPGGLHGVAAPAAREALIGAAVQAAGGRLETDRDDPDRIVLKLPASEVAWAERVRCEMTKGSEERRGTKFAHVFILPSKVRVPLPPPTSEGARAVLELLTAWHREYDERVQRLAPALPGEIGTHLRAFAAMQAPRSGRLPWGIPPTCLRPDRGLLAIEDLLHGIRSMRAAALRELSGPDMEKDPSLADLPELWPAGQPYPPRRRAVVTGRAALALGLECALTLLTEAWVGCAVAWQPALEHASLGELPPEWSRLCAHGQDAAWRPHAEGLSLVVERPALSWSLVEAMPYGYTPPEAIARAAPGLRALEMVGAELATAWQRLLELQEDSSDAARSIEVALRLLRDLAGGFARHMERFDSSQ